MTGSTRKSPAEEQRKEKTEMRSESFCHCYGHGAAWRPGRRDSLRSRPGQGKVLADIAGWSRVLRLQGIRGLVCGLFRPDRRSA